MCKNILGWLKKVIIKKHWNKLLLINSVLRYHLAFLTL